MKETKVVFEAIILRGNVFVIDVFEKRLRKFDRI